MAGFGHTIFEARSGGTAGAADGAAVVPGAAPPGDPLGALEHLAALSAQDLERLWAEYQDGEVWRKDCPPAVKVPPGAADSLMASFGSVGPGSPELVFIRAVLAYAGGEIDEVGFVRQLGLYKPARERKAGDPALRAKYTRALVARFHREGFPKSAPDMYEGTAYHKAGELMGVSAATVLQICKGRR